MNKSEIIEQIPPVFSVTIDNNHCNKAIIGHKDELNIYFEVDINTMTVINTGSFDDQCIFEGKYENINDLCDTITSFK